MAKLKNMVQTPILIIFLSDILLGPRKSEQFLFFFGRDYFRSYRRSKFTKSLYNIKARSREGRLVDGQLSQKHRLKNKFPVAPFRNNHFNSDLRRRLSPHKPPQITVEMSISERCNSTDRRWRIWPHQGGLRGAQPPFKWRVRLGQLVFFQHSQIFPNISFIDFVCACCMPV